MKRSYSATLQKNINGLLILTIILVACFWFFRDYRAFKLDISQMRIDYFKSRKSIVVEQVKKSIEYIKFQKSVEEKRLKKELKERVNQAITIATNLYEKNRSKKTSHEIKKSIYSTLNSLRWKNARGYFFIIDLKGITWVHRKYPPGTDVYNLEDKNGKRIIQDFIKIAKIQGEGFSQYIWEKEPESGLFSPKLSFVKWFEPYQLIIGTGEYLDDVEHDTQNLVKERLSDIHFLDEEGYVFVVDYSGITLVNRTQPDMIGKNVLGLSDQNGVKFIQELLIAAKSTEGGFVEYIWKKPSTGKPAPKITFTKKVSEWKWCIGAGIYVDEIERVIAAKEENLKKEFFWKGLIMFFSLVVLLLPGHLISKHITGKATKDFLIFSSFFASAASKSEKIDLNRLEFNEFDQLAIAANKMLDERKGIEEQMLVFRKFAEASGQGLEMATLEGKITYINPVLSNLMNLKQPESIYGRQIHEQYPKKYKKKLEKEIIPHVLKTGQWTGELERLTHSEDGIPTLENFFLIHDENNYPIYLANVITDISNLKNIQHDLKGHQHHLEEQVKERTSDLKESNINLMHEINERIRAEKINRTLFEITNTINTTLNIDEVYRSIHHSLKRIIDVTNFYIGVYEEERDTIVILFLVDEIDDTFTEFPDVSGPDYLSLTYEVIKSGRPLLIRKKEIEDWVKKEGKKPLGTIPEIWLGVPLKIKNRVTGVMTVQSYTDPEMFDKKDVDILSSVSDQVAIAIERKKSEADLTKSNLELQKEIIERKRAEKINRTLFSISSAIITTFNLNELYESIHYALQEVIDVKNFYISLYNHMTDYIQFPYFIDKMDSKNSYKPFPLTSDSLTSEVIRSRTPLFLNQDDLLEREAKKTIQGTTPKVWVGVPLMIKDKVIGVMAVQSYTDPDLYDEKDVEILNYVSDQVAIAIERKREEVERIRLGIAIEQAAEAFIVCNTQGIIEYVNPAFKNITGYSQKEAVGQSLDILKISGDEETIDKKLIETVNNGKTWKGKLAYKNKNKKYSNAEMTISPVRDPSGDIVNIVSVARDVSREDELVAQLYQAQKMESIGTLAGGIAHDFNNILSAIMGYTETANLHIKGNEKAKSRLEKVLKACERSKDLINQILSFSRRKELKRAPVRIGPIIKETLKLLHASLSTTIKIQSSLETELDMVNTDPTQIHQILMNLCTNANQAMGEKGGILKVTMKGTYIDSETAQHADIKAGSYLHITVSDTGSGIKPELMNRIFDPYFTTKEKGEGTGLGLAVVHGIVKSHGGTVFVESEPGKGTAFHFFLPRIAESLEIEKQSITEELPKGHERILLVDDEEALVEIYHEMIETLGYKIISKTDSLQALELFRKKPDSFDLIITDLTMPNMTGDQLAKEILKIRPDIPIILCTGYGKNISPQKALQMGFRNFVLKPVIMEDLARLLRKILD